MEKVKRILHTWNTFGKVGVRYEDRTVETIDLKWYFAIESKDRAKAREVLRGTSGLTVEEDPKFPGFLKIFCPFKQDERSAIVLRLEEAGISTYEGDLLNDRRWYIDSEVDIGSAYKKLWFDIETDDTLPRIEIGRDRILSFAGIDQDGKVHFVELEEFTDEAEEKMLKKILKIIGKYDLILGWNSAGFDVPYLKERMRRYQIHQTDAYIWKEVGHFDLLKRFRHIFRFDNHIKSFSLENISQHFLQKGKVDRTEKTIELWRTNKAKLKEYNIQDSVLVKELDEELGVSEMMVRQSSWCGVPVGQFGLYSIIDAYIMRSAHRVGKFVKTSVRALKERNSKNERGSMNPDETTTEGAQYSGAVVLEPEIGKYGDVYTFDFKGLYPSLMRTSNIGYDTLRYEADGSQIVNPGTQEIPRMTKIVKPTYFLKEPSVINLAISELITKRSEYKKLKLKMIEDGKDKGPKWERVVSDEIIVKELANSTYGIMGLQYGRYFSVDVAESITLFGQWCINFARDFFNRNFGKVIYGDTDSVFVATEGDFDPIKALERFHYELWETLKTYNIEKSFIQLEYDKHYSSMILLAKKNYAGRTISIEGKKTDQVYIRGMDCIKKSTFGFAAEKQRELIHKILHETVDVEQMRTWVKEVKAEFFKKDFKVEELVLINRIGKKLEDYKSKAGLHIRLAQLIFERTGEFQVNREIEYVITGHANTKLDGVLKEEFNGKFDREYYWENKTVPVLDRVLKVMFPDDDLFSDQLKLF